LSTSFIKKFNNDEPKKGLTDLNTTFFNWLLMQGHSEFNAKSNMDSVGEISTYTISTRKTYKGV
jgi:hypothetical protein